MICTSDDPEGRPTVFKNLPPIEDGRWICVGRLDINTSGLLLFTNDGELANRLMHPSSRVKREYAVRVLGQVDDATCRKLLEGIELDDGPARFESLHRTSGDGANQWYQVVLREGRNHEVKRLWESVGATVSRLIRVRYGNVALPRSLQKGKWLELGASVVDRLASRVGLSENPHHNNNRRNSFQRGNSRKKEEFV